MTAEARPEYSEQRDTEEPNFRGTVAVETHGCKLNQADSETLARRFQEAGYRLVSVHQSADVYVVNTCTVTHVADSKARQALRSAHRRNPDATVVATGCYAQRDPEVLAAVQGVDLVLGNGEKLGLVERVRQVRGDFAEPAEYVATDELLPYQPARSRAMVKIQEGCNQVCAYCIVPKVRGRERSIPPAELVKQVQSLESEGLSRGGPDRHPTGLLRLRSRRPDPDASDRDATCPDDYSAAEGIVAPTPGDEP